MIVTVNPSVVRFGAVVKSFVNPMDRSALAGAGVGCVSAMVTLKRYVGSRRSFPPNNICGRFR